MLLLAIVGVLAVGSPSGVAVTLPPRTSGGSGGPSSSSTSDRDAWVDSACTVVETGSSSGSLYDCSGAMGG